MSALPNDSDLKSAAKAARVIYDSFCILAELTPEDELTEFVKEIPNENLLLIYSMIAGEIARAAAAGTPRVHAFAKTLNIVCNEALRRMESSFASCANSEYN